MPSAQSISHSRLIVVDRPMDTVDLHQSQSVDCGRLISTQLLEWPTLFKNITFVGFYCTNKMWQHYYKLLNGWVAACDLHFISEWLTGEESCAENWLIFFFLRYETISMLHLLLAHLRKTSLLLHCSGPGQILIIWYQVRTCRTSNPIILLPLCPSSLCYTPHGLVSIVQKEQIVYMSF